MTTSTMTDDRNVGKALEKLISQSTAAGALAILMRSEIQIKHEQVRVCMNRHSQYSIDAQTRVEHAITLPFRETLCDAANG